VQVSVAAIIIMAIVLVLVMSTIAYLVRARRVRQSFISFFIRYIAIFGALFLIEYAFLELLPSLHEALRNLTATIVGGIVGLAWMEPVVSGPLITLQDPSLAFDITVGCLGGVLFWVYIGLVFAESGITRRQRILGIAAGLSVLLAFNIFRMALSLYLQELTGVYVHDYFYFFNIVFVLLVWAVWTRTLRVKAAVVSSAT